MADKTHTYEWQPTKIGRKLVRVPIKSVAVPSPVKNDDRVSDAGPTEPEPKAASVYMTKAELVALAEERGVDSSGTRPELIERLALDD